MDPLWPMIAEIWWVAPAAAGAGTLGWFGLRRQRAADARRLEYDAARHDLRASKTAAASARAAARLARAELAHALADREAKRASSGDVAGARQSLQRAQLESRAAAADVYARRAAVTAARTALPRTATDPLPLARLLAKHDAITARWMPYETDAHKRLTFPTMSDARQPATAAFLGQLGRAQELRPASAQSRITPADFAAYRDAVRQMGIAFEVAEAEAWRRARADGTVPPADARAEAADRWSFLTRTMTETLLSTSADAITRAAESVARKTRRTGA